jgi:hypothetical protein
MNREIKMMDCSQQIVSEQYRSPVMFALALEIPIAFLCFLMLDGGHLAKICGIAMAAHGAGIGIIMSRRPQIPTAIDRVFIRIGFLMIFLPLIAIRNLL